MRRVRPCTFFQFPANATSRHTQTPSVEASAGTRSRQAKFIGHWASALNELCPHAGIARKPHIRLGGIEAGQVQITGIFGGWLDRRRRDCSRGRGGVETWSVIDRISPLAETIPDSAIYFLGYVVDSGFILGGKVLAWEATRPSSGYTLAQ